VRWLKASKTGDDQVLGRVMRESGDRVLPPNTAVAVCFVGYVIWPPRNKPAERTALGGLAEPEGISFSTP
jgi:hypothetical protein